MIYFFYIISGFISGVFGGLGMGGGTLLIPILTIFLGMEQKSAQGINLMTFIVMAIVSICIHFKNGYIYTKNIYLIIIFGIIFSIIGSFLMSFLPSFILKYIFAVFLCILAIVEFIKVFK